MFSNGCLGVAVMQIQFLINDKGSVLPLLLLHTYMYSHKACYCTAFMFYSDSKCMTAHVVQSSLQDLDLKVG